MRVLVVYESIFGNTRQIANSVARGVRDTGLAVDLVEVSSAPQSALGYDLLVVGGPTHAWSMTRASTRDDSRAQAAKLERAPVSKGNGIREWLAALEPTSMAKRAAVFDTIVKTKWIPTGSAAKAAAKRLRRVGSVIVDDAQHFHVSDTAGPLTDGELERARAWGTHLATLLAGESAAAPEAPVTL